MAATVIPGLGLLGTSLRRDGDEFLALPRSLDDYAKGHTTGLPLLAPWANRLAGDTYKVGNLTVDLAGAPRVHRDGQRPAHPRHARRRRRVAGGPAGHRRAQRGAGVAPRRGRAARPARVVPLPPRAHRRAPTRRHHPDRGHHRAGHRPAAGAGGLRLAPLPAPPGHPARLDAGHPAGPAPPGRSTSAASPPGRAIAWRPRPSCWAAGPSTTSSPWAAIGGWAWPRASTRSACSLDRNYGYVQVYAPAEANLCCLEPMTAPTNALVTGSCPYVSPGQSFTARFSLTVT